MNAGGGNKFKIKPDLFGQIRSVGPIRIKQNHKIDSDVAAGVKGQPRRAFDLAISENWSQH